MARAGSYLIVGCGRNPRVKARLLLPLLGFVACVPTGSAPPYDAGTTAPATPAFKPSIGIMTQPFEDTFDRPDAGEGDWAPLDASAPDSAAPGKDGGGDAAHALLPTPSAAPGLDGGAPSLGIADGGPPPRPSNLGPNWIQARTNAWRVENGRLCGQGARNHPVWLNKVLPVNARIEFDAISTHDDGDLKCEVWGDGQSYARSTSYTDATSYLAILGGWHNSLHVLARLNEHGEDRKVLPVDKNSDDPRQRPVMKGQVYHFKVERTDGKTIHFSVDGLEYLKWVDPAPLAGQGHDHFGFNEWEAKVCFDNVKVTPLP